MKSWAEKLSAELAKVPGVFLGRCRFADKPAWLAHGKEILHFHGEDVVDLKLGKKEIRSRREELRADPRVTLRKSSSAEWLEVGIRSRKDLLYVVSLVKIAASGRSASGSERRR
jgi:hypothetical protein